MDEGVLHSSPLPGKDGYSPIYHDLSREWMAEEVQHAHAVSVSPRVEHGYQISGLDGPNVESRNQHIDWYRGPPTVAVVPVPSRSVAMTAGCSTFTNAGLTK